MRDQPCWKQWNKWLLTASTLALSFAPSWTHWSWRHWWALTQHHRHVIVMGWQGNYINQQIYTNLEKQLGRSRWETGVTLAHIYRIWRKLSFSSSNNFGSYCPENWTWQRKITIFNGDHIFIHGWFETFVMLVFRRVLETACFATPPGVQCFWCLGVHGSTIMQNVAGYSRQLWPLSCATERSWAESDLWHASSIYNCSLSFKMSPTPKHWKYPKSGLIR